MGFSRRQALQVMAAVPIAGAAVGGVPAAASAAPSDRPAGSPTDSTLQVLDLAEVHDYDVHDPAEALLAYGWLHVATTLQGIVNRDRPRLFVDFLRGDEKGDLRIDQYWLSLAEEVGWSAVAQQAHVTSIAAAVKTFRDSLSGAVVWDPSVPATSNVASTVAGADDVIALPYDPDPRSAYSVLVDPDAPGRDGAHPDRTQRHKANPDSVGSARLPVLTWLIQRDGTPRFTGSGRIPDLDKKSTGSAKADAYWWAHDRYLATGRSNPVQLAYFLDAYWLQRTAVSSWPYPIQNSLLSNHDFLVSERGFVFDLSFWPDEAPEDDLDQQPGTDLQVLEAILATAARRSKDQIRAIRGFVPWAFKYTSAASDTSRQLAGHAEWKFIEIASSYGCFVDADAEGLDPMANASVLRHYQPPRHYPAEPEPTHNQLRTQGYLDADGRVVAHRYVMIYTGDYDSAAWMYHLFPRVWQDDARGTIPINWAFDPLIAERNPLALSYAHETAGPHDHFISGDSGAGYVSPGALAPRLAAGPGWLHQWTERNLRSFQDWGLTATGFVIDGTAPPLTLDQYESSYGRFSPAGVVTSVSGQSGIFGRTPYVRMGGDLSGAESLVGDLKQAPYETAPTTPPLRPQFHPVRTIVKSPSWHKDLMAAFSDDIPAPPFDGVRTVSDTLAESDVEDGLARVDLADGQSEPVTVGGRNGRSTAGKPTDNRYLYFDIDNSVAHDNSFAATFTIDYFDSGTTPVNLQYDGTDPFAGAGSIPRTDSQTWRTATLQVGDARLADRQQGQADFRLEVLPGQADLVVGQITVELTARPSYADGKIEFLDAPTFFALLRRHLLDSVVVDCSAGILTPGATTDLVFRLHNNHDRSTTVPVSVRTGAGEVSPRTRSVTIAARSSRRVTFSVDTPADSDADTGNLVVRLGSGASSRKWIFAPRQQHKSYREAGRVGVELGESNRADGLTQLELGFDGTTVTGTTAGRSYRQSALQPNGFTDEGYLYFAVDDTYLIDEDAKTATVTVVYFDHQPGMTFRLDYDAVDGARMLDGVLTATQPVHTSGSGQWRTATFRLRRLAFANRINGSPDGRPVGVADFRIATADPIKFAEVHVTRH